MRQALVRKARPGTSVAHPYPRIAPVKGWMTSQNLADMDENAAVVMDNWFPETDSVRMRRGSTTFATLPTTDPIRTLMVYNAGGVTDIFAAQGAKIYDVTAGGSISSAAVTGQSSDKYISVNFATAGGNFLVAANGTDAVLNYNGTAWSTPAITGVASATLNYVFQSKNRLWFCQNNTATAWYLPVNSIAGAAGALNLGPLFSLGGTLIAGASLLVNSQNGPNDYTVFISSEGQVAIYLGNDPSDPANWTLQGVMRISKPIPNRCAIQIAGDIGVLCADGLISLTKSIQLDLAAEQKAAYSGNIRLAFNNQYNLTGNIFGWQIISWPTAHMAIVNVPTTLDVTSEQYVLNVLTGAWGRYLNMNASCFALAGTQMYYGSTGGAVVAFEKGNSDDGTSVNATMIPAYSDMKAAGRLKHVKNMQTFFRGSGQYQICLNIAVDFQAQINAVTTQDISATVGALWDVALWDVGVWATPGLVNVIWLGVAGGGYYLAPVIFAISGNTTTDDTDIQFLSMNLLTENGAIFG